MALDKYQSIATIAVTESAANTITFSALTTGLGFGTKRGMLIDAVEFHLTPGSLNLILDEADQATLGLTVSSGVTDLTDFTDRRIITMIQLDQLNSGTPANAQLIKMPMTSLLGTQGLPIAETSLFLGVAGVSLATALSARCRIFFRYIDLTDRDILEIAQNFQLVG